MTYIKRQPNPALFTATYPDEPGFYFVLGIDGDMTVGEIDGNLIEDGHPAFWLMYRDGWMTHVDAAELGLRWYKIPLP